METIAKKILRNMFFYRLNESGDAAILHVKTGEPVTRMEMLRGFYCVNSGLSTHYEHPEGIVLSLADVQKLGLTKE